MNGVVERRIAVLRTRANAVRLYEQSRTLDSDLTGLISQLTLRKYGDFNFQQPQNQRFASVIFRAKWSISIEQVEKILSLVCTSYGDRLRAHPKNVSGGRSQVVRGVTFSTREIPSYPVHRSKLLMKCIECGILQVHHGRPQSCCVHVSPVE
jgi:hypothetical protein